jgi:hypothetical protein
MDQYLCRNRNILIGVITCLLLAGIPPVMASVSITAAPSTTGTITVLTWPAGAAVYLDGEFSGTTPLNLENLAPGRYQIDVSMAGFRNETIIRTISPGSMHEIGINLESLSAVRAPDGSGSIAVDSSPGGAAVTLDGIPVGTTPDGRAALILNAVPAGNHTVTVGLAGYPPYTSTVTVIKNHVVQVNADFVPRSPTIPGTPIATTARPDPVPLSPLTVVAAACLAGLAAVFCRS